MKIRKEVIDERIIKTTKTVYECEKCDFTSDKEYEALEHCAGHALKESHDDEDLYKFDSEEDAKTWVEQFKTSGYDERSVEWGEPGWYTLKRYTKPCPRNCCTDQCIKLYPASELLYELQYDLRQLKDKVYKLEKIIEGP